MKGRNVYLLFAAWLSAAAFVILSLTGVIRLG